MPELKPLTVTVDAKGMPLPATDPNVALPPRVAAAAATADALHAQAYPTQSPSPTPPPTQSPPPPPTQSPPPPPASGDVDADRASWDGQKWMAHAKSMEGRWKQVREQNEQLQGQLTDIGQELITLQSSRPTVTPPVAVHSAPAVPVQQYVTPQDVETYGEDFLNAAQRAALQVVAPRLQTLEQQNQTLQRKLQKAQMVSIESILDAQVPTWPQINLSPRFKNWLRLRDVYSGQVRSKLLNDAHAAGDATRVATFFKGFLSEEEATGSTEFLPRAEPSPKASPHTPSVELQSLTAPGHARPAAGSSPNAPVDGPIWITRGQVKQFYENVRKGVYAGREQDYHNDQAIIFDCQQHGRIR